MNRRRKGRSRGGMWGWIGLVVICFAGGCVAAWVWSGREANAAVKSMSRAELEREVSRLRAQLDERDRQLADLMIEQKLREAGSAGPGSGGE